MTFGSCPSLPTMATALPASPVVVLAGGTGGAKLARGMLDVVGDELVVVANTGDDVEIYGAHVSPDPDLVAFWLADRIDARGWGLEGDTFHAMDAPARPRRGGLVQPRRRGPRDRARPRPPARGGRAADATRSTRSRGRSALACRVLPMADDPVRTWVTDERTPFQEWMIRAGGKRRDAPSIGDVEFRGAAGARRHAGGAEAIARPRGRSSSGPATRSSRSARSSPCPGCARRCRRGRARRGGLSDRRRRGGQGADGGVPRVGGPRARRTGSPRLYAGLLDGLVADEACDGAARAAHGRGPARRRRRAAGSPARRWRSPRR